MNESQEVNLSSAAPEQSWEAPIIDNNPAREAQTFGETNAAGHPHGQGGELWPDGSRYEGEYVDGKKEGFGRFSWADGSRYAGEFRENQIDGKGEYVFADGREYVGEFKESRMEGFGVFTWKDKRKYEGHYVANKKDGYGTFFWVDGRVHQGQWKNGVQHGPGRFYSKGSEARDGLWENGKFVEWTSEPFAAEAPVPQKLASTKFDQPPVTSSRVESSAARPEESAAKDALVEAEALKAREDPQGNADGTGVVGEASTQIAQDQEHVKRGDGAADSEKREKKSQACCHAKCAIM